MTSTDSGTIPQEDPCIHDNTVYIYSPDKDKDDGKKKDKYLSKKSPVEKKIKNPLKALRKLAKGQDKQFQPATVQKNNQTSGKYNKNHPEISVPLKEISAAKNRNSTTSRENKTTSATSLVRGDISIKRKSEGFFTKLLVEKLPQTFPIRYLGSVPCSGLFGLDQIKKPVAILLNLYGADDSKAALSYNSASVRNCPRSKMTISETDVNLCESLDKDSNSQSDSSSNISNEQKGDKNGESTEKENQKRLSASNDNNSSSSKDQNNSLKRSSNTDNTNLEESSEDSQTEDHCSSTTKSLVSLKSNNSSSPGDFNGFSIPLQLISYASQDNKNPCLFVMMEVLQMSSNGHKSQCHVFVCHTKEQSQKMALAMALAFKQYTKQLEANKKSSPFKVQLESTASESHSEEPDKSKEVCDGDVKPSPNCGSNEPNNNDGSSSLMDDVLKSINQ